MANYNEFILIPCPEEYVHLKLMVTIWQSSGQWSHGGGLLGGNQENFLISRKRDSSVKVAY